MPVLYQMLVCTGQFLPNVHLIVLILHQCNENEIWSLDVENIGQISLKELKIERKWLII